jgi:hypothetical protein
VDGSGHCMELSLIEITPKKVSTDQLGFSFHGLIKKECHKEKVLEKRDLILPCLY